MYSVKSVYVKHICDLCTINTCYRIGGNELSQESFLTVTGRIKVSSLTNVFVLRPRA
jgi:hypothetical protein